MAPRRPRPCPTNGDPCPWVACRHHLWTEVVHVKGGGYTLRPSRPWGDHDLTCVLRVASSGPKPREHVAAILGISATRVADVEIAALALLREHPGLDRSLLEAEPEGSTGDDLLIDAGDWDTPSKRRKPSRPPMEPVAQAEPRAQAPRPVLRRKRETSTGLAIGEGRGSRPCPTCGRPLANGAWCSTPACRGAAWAARARELGAHRRDQLPPEVKERIRRDYRPGVPGSGYKALAARENTTRTSVQRIVRAGASSKEDPR